MRLRPRFSTFSAFGLGLILSTASVQAEVFDWNNVSYKPTTTATGAPQTALVNSAVTSNTLSLSITLTNGAAFLGATSAAPSPVSGSNTTNTASADNTFNANYAVGGQATTQKALQLGANFGSNTQYMLVTILFAKPVTAVSFSFFDIDTPATTATTQYVDQVRGIQAVNSDNGTTVTPISLVNTNNTYTNVDSSTQVTGKLISNQPDATGNATATFSSSTSISQFSFIYGDAYTGTTAHANGQLIALGNITFTTVPEPGTVAMLGMGLVGAASAVFRRRR